MSKKAVAVMPEINQESSEIPLYYRERLSNSTLGEFKKKVEDLLSAIDDEEKETPVRMLVEQRHKEYSIACWSGEAFLRFTFDKERRF